MKTHSQRSSDLLLRFWSAYLKRICAPRNSSDAGIVYWRERVLQYVAAAGLLIALFVVIPSAVILFRSGYIFLPAFDIAAFAVVLVLLWLPGLSYRFRTFIVLGALYTMGIAILVNLGAISGGPVWLFSFAVVTAVLLGLRGAIVAVLINAITIFIFAWLRHKGVVAMGQPYYPTVGRIFAAGINFVFLNALVAFSVSGLTRGLQSVISRAHRAHQELLNEMAARRQIERELAASEEKYRLLAENITDILWSTDMALNITYTSPAVETILGWRPEELKQRHVSELLTHSSMTQSRAVLDKVLAQAEAAGDFARSVTLELSMRHKNGTTVLVEVRCAFILGENGRPLGILGVNRDITRRVEAQREKEALQAQLSQSRKMEALGLLAGGVAHDLNNVLSGIVSYPDLLLLDLPDDSPLRPPIETIRQTGIKATEIVQDLLTLARRGVQTMVPLSLNDVIQDYLASPEHLELIGRYEKVAVETDLASDIEKIKGSATHLKKAIMNLVANAAEAQPEGGTITICTTRYPVHTPLKALPDMPSGDYVRITIADGGTGIAPADLTRIFEPFFTRKVMGRSGSGLGMAVVWGTVQDHDGYICVESHENRGTIFKLHFPVTSEADAASVEAVDPAAYQGRGETILVVDDVAEQRLIATKILQRLGYRTMAADSGEAALACFDNHGNAPVDAVVLDMIMPGMDGLDTYRAICRTHGHVHALIASGFSETQRVKEALALGVGAYIKKPYMLKELGLALRKILAKGG